jgi:alkanesulfonate monooxygenase SsuD/methylene tetrahydromethanopterin reductase-like flavin-dependent oxidoreductase (luciferase family)
MDIGLAMSTHGLLTRDERDFFLRRLEPDAMRPIELAQLAERLGYHSLWFSDHVCMGRDLGAKHTANESGTRAYPERPVMLDVVATIGALAAVNSYADPARFDRLRDVVLREGERVGRDLSGFRFYAFASGLVTDPVADGHRRTLTGNAEQVLGDLARFAAHGYSHVTLYFEVASGTIEELFEIVQRFAAEVLPEAAVLEAAPLQ